MKDGHIQKMHLKIRCFLGLCLLPLLTQAQSYPDSMRLLHEALLQEVYQAETPDSAEISYLRQVIDTLTVLGPIIDDTLLLQFSYPFQFAMGHVEAYRQVNELIGRICQQRLREDSSAKTRTEILPFLVYHYESKGWYAQHVGDVDGSISYAYEALGVARDIQDTARMIKNLMNLGIVSDNLDDDAQAETLLLEAYELAKAQARLGVPAFVSICFQLGKLWTGSGEYDKARTILQEADSLARAPHNRVKVKIGLADYHMRQSAFAQAKSYYDEALRLSEGPGGQYARHRAIQGLARVHLEMGKLAAARAYTEQAIRLSRAAGFWGANLGNYKSMIGILEKEGKYREANEFYRKFLQLNDSMRNEQSSRELVKQEYKFQYEQAALADSLETASVLAVEREENKRRKTISWFLAAGLLLMALFGWALYTRYRLIQRQKQALDVANGKLRELDDFKSSFFTNISHEFRTPLTVIQGMIGQVQEKPEKWLNKGSEIIQRNTSSLLNFVNQILDLRKLESGHLTLEWQQADVIRFLRLGVASFESMAEIKQVALVFEAEEESLTMDIDPEKLAQVQTNLLSNAIKFTPEGGSVAFQVRKQAQSLEITVADTGLGIPPEKLPLVFERFYQVDGTATRQGEGTGIGLSLTRELVSLMGGTIEVESEVDKGSSFKVLLPITTNAPLAPTDPIVPASASASLLMTAAEPPMQAVPPRQALPSLLIIEDNPDIVAYLYACLDDQYELSSAPDGQAGIEAAFEQVPDLIISDVMMPRKNGYEVCETLKLDERTSHIPIVLLTARADQPSRLEGYQRGADAYLPKPFDLAELQIRLEQLARLRQRLQIRYQGGQAPAEPSEDPQVQAEDAFIIQVRSCILDHLDDSQYRGDMLMKDLGLSRTNLHRKLKALTGLSTSHFIRSIRLDEAKKLLRNPEIRISEIAYATGFNDPKYFNRVFVETQGCSPSDWRIQLTS